MQGFFQQLQWKLADWMQGRRGTDEFNRFLLAAAIILLLLSIVPNLGALSYVVFAVLVYSMFRSFSKNIPARERENDAYLRYSEKPRHWYAITRKRFVNRKTTKYFKCKGCGQVLSVPRGKGTLRVVCPKCKTETTQKS